MKRKIITIDENLCNGCGLCVKKCAEGALKIIDGKARLISEVYCDGLGACIGDCPQGAIIIEEREARPFDESEVHKHLQGSKGKDKDNFSSKSCDCPGSALNYFKKEETPMNKSVDISEGSKLSTWPVQLLLVPVDAPFLKGADLLICADCVPFALVDFHNKFLNGRVALVGCPKLDDIAFYREKLRDIFLAAKPSSITVLRMTVPCCGGIAQAVLSARNEALSEMKVQIYTVGIRGEVTCEEVPPS
jgi:NAD-dependent dihydropyrimidine dehydrogenase PreA subunit